MFNIIHPLQNSVNFSRGTIRATPQRYCYDTFIHMFSQNLLKDDIAYALVRPLWILCQVSHI